MYMLDTNIVAAALKNNPGVRARLTQVSNRDVCISVITLAELRYGLHKRASKHRDLLVNTFLQAVNILPWDEQAAECHGALRAELEKKGISLAPLDMQIAAHALAINATLVTNDQAFRQLHEITVVDWVTQTL